MMNITLISLNVFSLISMSPFFNVNRVYKDRVSATIINSHFTRSFTSVLYSSTSFHSTLLRNNEFSHILNGAIVFVSNEEETKKKLTIVKNKEMLTRSEYKNADEYGDITIASCTFKNCLSTTFGGAIYIEQECSVVLHDSIFDSCSALDGAGGYICKVRKERSKDNGEITDEKLKQIDVQYCCFQKCKVVNNDKDKTGFGSALLLSGENIQLLYASSVNCPGNEQGTEKARGAQFDIHSGDISSKYVNATGGFSKYCGSIEYRGSSKGTFMYQTIMDMDCMFVIAFSKFENVESLDIQYCNLINNKISNYDNNAGTYPALIHVRQQNIQIKNFAFLKNDICEDGRIASKEEQINNIYPEQQIDLIDCYADSYVSKEAEAFTTKDCNFGLADKLTLNDIPQLNLGECKGNVPPPELIITKAFTPSNEFSNSYAFTKSGVFTKSEAFTKSDIFTKSSSFTKSEAFTKSNQFQVVNPQKGNEGKKLKPAEIAGIAVGVVAAVAIIGLIVFFVIRKHKLNIIDNEEVETIDSSQASTNTDNPIYSKKAEDDPFKEDFENN